MNWRYTHRSLLLCTLAFMVTMVARLAISPLVVGDALAVYAVGVCFVGLAISWGAPLQSRLMDQFTAADRGVGFELVRTVYMTTGASGSVIIGAVADLYGWDVSFGMLAVVMAVVLGALAGNRLLDLGL